MGKPIKRYFNFASNKQPTTNVPHVSFYNRVLEVINSMISASPPAFTAPGNISDSDAQELTGGGETSLHTHAGVGLTQEQIEGLL